MKGNRLVLTLAAPVMAIVFAMVASTLVLVLSDNSVTDVLEVMWNQVTSMREIVQTLNRAAPYYVSGVAVAIGFKMNLFNIGVEGQYRLAGVVAAAAGAALPLPGPTRLLGVLATAMLVGAAWAGIAGVLRAYRGVSEVISTIMLNAIALGLTPFLLTRYFVEEKEAGTVDYAVRTDVIPKGGRLPMLDFLPTAGSARLNTFIVIAALVGVAYWALIWRSRFGYDLRASGENPNAARASGVNAKQMTVVAMVISGAIAGLVGLSTIVSSPYSYTEESFLSGLGFTGIAIALLGRNNPVGIAFGAFLWSFIDIARTPLSGAQLPREIATIVQGIIVLSVVIAYEVVRRLGQRWEAAAIAREIGDSPEEPPPSAATATAAGAHP
ncbi:ABC transporter permease [Iamia sp. SCSIO 61187]|uniref:ABC transporter permease n=1 Tax=Iamia sp. SCSIO 61187 TaxID=2722752 RepID=UPI001C638B23|nr:ABC transporter permease [Iamia sp. SCSIO 61187]QYG93564.1 ABC transporter permease [Iamia sp. SCSIO 61187]